MRSHTKKFANVGVISALYAAISLLTFPIASGAIQIRIAEAMCLLPLIIPEATLGLFIGCLLCNLLTGCAPFDVVFGSLITLVAAFSTFGIGKLIKSTALKVFIGGLFPVLLNAFLLPLIWLYCYGAIDYLYCIQVIFILLGQGVSVYLFGVPLYLKIKKINFEDNHKN